MDEKELLKNGWRRCAINQKTTQWCATAEATRQELCNLITLLNDARINNSISAQDSLTELMYLFHELANVLNEIIIEEGLNQVSDTLKIRCYRVMTAYQKRICYQVSKTNFSSLYSNNSTET